MRREQALGATETVGDVEGLAVGAEETLLLVWEHGLDENGGVHGDGPGVLRSSRQDVGELPRSVRVAGADAAIGLVTVGRWVVGVHRNR